MALFRKIRVPDLMEIPKGQLHTESLDTSKPERTSCETLRNTGPDLVLQSTAIDKIVMNSIPSMLRGHISVKANDFRIHTHGNDITFHTGELV